MRPPPLDPETARRGSICAQLDDQAALRRDDEPPPPHPVAWTCRCATAGNAPTVESAHRDWLLHAKSAGCSSIAYLDLVIALDRAKPKQEDAA